MSDEPRLENLAATPYSGLDDDEAHASIRQHYETFFDREGEELTWPHGAGRARLGAFRVLRIPPNEETGLWTYASVGAFALGPPSVDHAPAKPETSRPGADSLEFALLLPQANDRGVELVTMVAHYHNAERLGLGHRFPIGEPWLPGATCNALLVSLPYPFGATLEHLRVGPRQVRITWLLPITEAERRFAAQQGLEALEQRFDDAPVEYWRLDRASVV